MMLNNSPEQSRERLRASGSEAEPVGQSEQTGGRNWQVLAAKCAIGGGLAAFLGSLLPFLATPDPELYTISSDPKDSAAFFGVVLALLGGLMLTRSRRVQLISGILAFVVAGLADLTLIGAVTAGLVGINQADALFGTVHVTWSPQIGVIISILGCCSAGIGGMLTFRPR